MRKVGKLKGYLTVYLSLTIGVLLSFVLVVIEGVRMQTVKLEAECVTDMALNSIFAEYNRQLLEQYELFYIDSSYGGESPSYENTEAHIRKYMNMNFEKEVLGVSFFIKDITGLRVDNATIEKAAIATDDNGEVLAYQISQYMKHKMGITTIENMLQVSQQLSGWENSDIASQRASAEETIHSMLEEKNSQREETEDEITINNPADAVNSTRTDGIFGAIYPSGKTISGEQVQLSEYVSYRTLEVGNGLALQDTETGVIDQALIQQYIFQQCGYYGSEKENSKLKYQIEYLLVGKNNDAENLKEVLNRLLIIREAANVAYLFSDADKQAQADAMALSITASVGMPGLQQAVKMSIIFAWSYAESVKDMRILMDGYAVPAVKTNDTWNTPLTQLVSYQSYLGSYTKTSQGMNYRQYLDALLWITSTDTRMYRLMDIIEMDIRKTNGNSNFKMDGCFDCIEAKMNVSSSYGYGYEITRMYSYE
ncbi:MAG: DUF5702 domain-containing protein [Eubacteriales bacterium]